MGKFSGMRRSERRYAPGAPGKSCRLWRHHARWAWGTVPGRVVWFGAHTDGARLRRSIQRYGV